MKRGLVLGLGLLALTGAALLLGGCEEKDVADFFGAASNVTATTTEIRDLVIEEPLEVFVASSNGAVSIVGRDDVQTVSLTIRRRSRGETLEEARDRVDRIRVRVEQNGPRLDVAYRSGEQDEDVRRFSGVDFDVIVPMQTQVSVDTSNGRIDLFAVAGRQTLDTSNGEISVRSGRGTLDANTSNGRITVVDHVGEVRADTSNGDIRIDRATGFVDAETSNGSIQYSGTPGEGVANRLRTSNGTIDAQVPTDASIAFEIHASSGRITSLLPLVGDTTGEDWSATLNPPAATSLVLRTSNGSIWVDSTP